MNGANFTSGMNVGIYGMQQASLGMQRSAQQIASAGMPQVDGGAATDVAITRGVDTTEALVNLKSNLRLFDASAKVVETSDQMIGHLLDIRA